MRFYVSGQLVAHGIVFPDLHNLTGDGARRKSRVVINARTLCRRCTLESLVLSWVISELFELPLFKQERDRSGPTHLSMIVSYTLEQSH